MIYYKDRDIAVCLKPYGIASQDDGKDNMISRLRNELSCEVYPVHRLDTATTGLIVYALNKKSAAKMSDAVARGELKKEYLAIVNGECHNTGELDDLLFHDRIKNKSFVISSERKGAKRALLTYRTLDTVNTEGDSLSLVRIQLLTGRTHQIRVQMANIRHPLYGDGKYGAKNNGRIHLHSAYLLFPHPVTGKEMKFSSLPDEGKWSLFKIKE